MTMVFTIMDSLTEQDIAEKVEYYLTEKAETLLPVLEELCEWGAKNQNKS